MEIFSFSIDLISLSVTENNRLERPAKLISLMVTFEALCIMIRASFVIDTFRIEIPLIFQGFQKFIFKRSFAPIILSSLRSVRLTFDISVLNREASE